METFFYVLGGVLVLLALGVSFFGMRSERFPSDGMLKVGILVVALVVAATAYGAVELSQEEALHREHEQNEAAATEEEEIATAETEATGEPDVGGSEAPGDRQESDTEPAGGGGEAQLAQGDPEAGAQVFDAEGCAGCHSLAAAGATGTIGPNLDTELAGKDPAFIETSIVDPDAEIAKGFQSGVMPVDYGDVLTPEDLANLVAFLSQSAGSGPESQTGETSSGE
jgi:cytochrome c553